MPRIARVMLAGWPFHITHRGNHRRPVFRSDADRHAYLSLLRRSSERYGMRVWAYCLMENHVHLIAVGEGPHSISKAVGNTHRRCSRLRNRADRVTGHLWANRFFSTILDEPHLWAAVRYVELNPVRAGAVPDATDYAWSSARAHAGLRTDALLDPGRPFPGPIGDWALWLRAGLDGPSVDRLRANTRTGRPTGSEEFVRDVEDRLGRKVRATRKGSDGD